MASTFSGGDISVVTICKDRLDHLRQSLPALAALRVREVILVDYDCPAGSGDWAEAHFPGVKVVRIKDQPHFSAAAARNRGAEAAAGPWLFFVDADVVTAPSIIEAAAPSLEEGVFFIAEPREPDLWGTIFVHRADFDALGGYDEVFEGWGGEDADLLDRLERTGRRQGVYDGTLARSIAHDDERRSRHHAVRDRLLSGGVNELYRQFKRDAEGLGLIVSDEARRRLYAELRGGFENGRTPEKFEVAVRRTDLWGLSWTTSLTYRPTRLKR